jgi:heterogeneous nuclear ribonucleoprotein A1/A3
MKDQERKRSRGFGFVTFTLSSCVTDVQADRPHKIDGKEVETKRATPKNQQAEGIDAKHSTKKLFIGGIKDEMTEDVIRAELSKFGNIEDVNIIKGKGFAFVRFDDHDPVDFCSLIGKFQLCSKWVTAKKAMEKKDQGMQGGGYGGGYGAGGGYGTGGYDDGYGGGYGNGYGGGDFSFGQGYQGSYGGGPVRSSGGYGGRAQPYGGGGGGGYGQGYGGGGGGGYGQGYGGGSGGGYGSGYDSYGSGGYGGGGGGYGGRSGGGYGYGK